MFEKKCSLVENEEEEKTNSRILLRSIYLPIFFVGKKQKQNKN